MTSPSRAPLPSGGAEPSVGSKAAGLVELRDAYPRLVPEFVLVPIADVVVGGAQWLSSATAAMGAALAGAADAEPAVALLAELSASVTLDAAALTAALGTAAGWQSVAVRTSALAEDGAEHSFAGLYESRLHVAPVDVAAAARECVQSLISERVLAYARARWLSSIEVGGSLVVQRMAFPSTRKGDLSGVMFTQTGSGHLEIAYSNLGPDAVVRGEKASTLRIAAVEPLPGRATWGRGKPPRALAALGRELQSGRGPSDVEWASRGGKVWLLQVRPITASDANSTIAWDSSNIGENYPGVTLPLTYSFIRHVYSEVYPAFFRLLGRSDAALREHQSTFGNTLGYLQGRVHYQIDNWFDMAAMLPGGKANQEFFASMLQPVKEGQAKQRQRPGLVGGLALVAGAARFAALLGSSERRSRRFRAQFDAVYSRFLAIDFASLAPDAALTSLATIRTQLLSMWAVPILNDVRLMVAHGLLKRTFGPENHAQYLNFLSGLSDRASIAPLTGLTELGLKLESLGVSDATATLSPDASALVDGYLRRFGGRAPDELQLENPRLGDNKGTLVALALSAAKAPPRPHVGVTPGGTLAQRLLGRNVRKAIDHRERFRFNRAQVFGIARDAYVSVGGALERAGSIESADDVFWLTHDEIDGAVFGHSWSTDLRPIVALRKAELDAHSRASLGRRVVGSGPVAPVSVQSETAAAPGEIAGQGVSPGRYTGEVLVLTEFDAHADVKGKVLVTGHVDPGWTLLFVSAGAIVTERGNALSHVAIIGRELGIPVVVAAAGATVTLNTGEEVTVDGTQGSVEVHTA